MTIKMTAKKACTKNTAFNLLKSLREGEALTLEEIDSILLRFAPAAPAKVKPNNVMAWVAKGVAKQDVREYLQYIRVEGGYAYGTNGHVLFKAKVDEADGWYCPKTLLAYDAPESWRAPKYDQLLNGVEYKHKFYDRLTVAEMTQSLLGRDAVYQYSTPDAHNVNLSYARVMVNRNYLDAATNADDSAEFNVHDNGGGMMVLHGHNAMGEWLMTTLRV